MGIAIVPRASGQWLDISDGRHWWFDSGSLALDFAYTGAIGDNPAWERLHTSADLAAWTLDRFPGIDATVREADLTDALALRAAIARLAADERAAHAPRPDDIDTVNLFAATPDIPPTLDGGTRQAGRTTPRLTQALATIARDAVRLFGADGGAHIRECAADDCSLIYVDSSPGGRRRWCSMQRCGNRAKVRAHRSRAAGAGTSA